MSTGGLTALAAKRFHTNNNANEGGSFDSESREGVKTKSDTHEKEPL
jgi:hypothetical protein